MALPPIAKATLQAALISAGSNVLAQGITSYRNEVRQFLVFSCQFFFLALSLVSTEYVVLHEAHFGGPKENTVWRRSVQHCTNNDQHADGPRLPYYGRSAASRHWGLRNSREIEIYV